LANLSFKVNAPKTLKNGAKVVDFRIYGSGEIIALCEWHGYHPFVTWRLDQEGNAYWGHYFETLEAAHADFEGRR